MDLVDCVVRMGMVKRMILVELEATIKELWIWVTPICIIN